MIDPEFKFREKYRVPSNQLNGYDYSSEGAYFITICTKNRENYFGEIENGKMVLNEIGAVADKYWQEMMHSFDNLIIDEFVIMPNHMHLIAMIQNVWQPDVETRRGVSLQWWSSPRFGLLPPKSIGSIINHYKWKITKYANLQEIPFSWQPNYHDHIIRDENELNRIRQYVADNPLQWEYDENYRE